MTRGGVGTRAVRVTVEAGTVVSSEMTVAGTDEMPPTVSGVMVVLVAVTTAGPAMAASPAMVAGSR